MNVSRETICAIATPAGEGAIGVIRVSGSKTQAILSRLFVDTKGKRRKQFEPLRIYKGSIRSKILIDQVLLFIDKAPNTYTGEDLSEIYCHNNPIILSQVMAALYSCGARLAEAGEFTRRRLLSGRIGLPEAESLLDLYGAKTEEAKEVALRHHLGDERIYLEKIRTKLLDLSTALEMSLEFQEGTPKQYLRTLSACLGELGVLLGNARYGRALKSGVKVVIVGPVNVGKSSLFNALLGRGRAIVSSTPGTTRDVVGDEYNYRGVLFKLFDTAGARRSGDLIEATGQKMADEAVLKADVVLNVSTCKNGQYKAKNVDENVMRTCINVCNKVDLYSVKSNTEKCVAVSAKTGKGIGALRSQIYKKACGNLQSDYNGLVLTNERHISCLRVADEALDEAMNSSIEELSVSSINRAISAIDEVSGLKVSDKIIDQIFSQFCVGK